MKKGLLTLLLGLGLLAPVFASFPVETQALISDPNRFRLDAWGFIIGMFTWILLPYSLLLLLVRKKYFRGSLALGWLAGIILTLLITVIVVISVLEEGDGVSWMY